jgi:hypothetical protein
MIPRTNDMFVYAHCDFSEDNSIGYFTLLFLHFTSTYRILDRECSLSHGLDG